MVPGSSWLGNSGALVTQKLPQYMFLLSFRWSLLLEGGVGMDIFLFQGSLTDVPELSPCNGCGF